MQPSQLLFPDPGPQVGTSRCPVVQPHHFPSLLAVLFGFHPHSLLFALFLISVRTWRTSTDSRQHVHLPTGRGAPILLLQMNCFCFCLRPLVHLTLLHHQERCLTNSLLFFLHHQFFFSTGSFSSSYKLLFLPSEKKTLLIPVFILLTTFFLFSLPLFLAVFFTGVVYICSLIFPHSFFAIVFDPLQAFRTEFVKITGNPVLLSCIILYCVT